MEEEEQNNSIDQTIRQSIINHDQKFQDLLCLIPAKYYIPPQSQPSTPHGTSKKKKKKSKKQELESLEDKRLKKRIKFDPDSLPTIPQLQGLNRSDQGAQRKSADKGSESDNQLNEEPSNEVHISRAELEAKLKAKITQIQQTSNQKISTTASQSESTTSKDDLLELARKKRGEMRDRRRKERKEVRRKEKMLKNATILDAKAKKKHIVSKKNKNAKGLSNLTEKDQKESSQPDQNSPKKATDTKSDSLNSVKKPQPDPSTSSQADQSSRNGKAQSAEEPDLAYSSISFGQGSLSINDGNQKRNRNPSWTSKNPKEAKIALDRREAYLAKLTPEAREKAEESKKWEKANLQASGIKVMDDAKKLDKSIKNQAKDHQKRKSKWEERVKNVEKSQMDQQKKRQENIMKRQQIIKEKKMKHVKGGKPGGSSSSFGGGGVKAKGNLKNKKTKNVKGF